MPRTRTTTRSRRRGGYLKYRRRQAMRSMISKRNKIFRGPLSQKTGFPKKLCMKHKYVETETMTNTLGLYQYYQWSCNSMYDPNTSIVAGHQPLYFDQVSPIYNHYTVIGSRIKLTLTPAEEYNVGTYLALFINDDTSLSSLSSIQNAAELHSGKYYTVAPKQNKPIVLYSKWSAKKTFGGSVLGNDNLQGSTSTSPSEQSYYTIMMAPISGAVVQTWYINAEIEYIAVWDELKEVASS